MVFKSKIDFLFKLDIAEILKNYSYKLSFLWNPNCGKEERRAGFTDTYSNMSEVKYV